MTVSGAIEKVLSIARKEIGTREGANNYNKYAAEPMITALFGWSLQNQPWCCIFVIWVLIQAFGLAKAMDVAFLFKGCSAAACKAWAGYYQQHGAWTRTPQAGFQIFFYASGDINHTGIVERVSGNTVYTIEGNTSDSVARRQYSISDRTIAGYGIPNYKAACTDDISGTSETASEDGAYPTETKELGYVTLKYGDGLNNPIRRVKIIQELLNEHNVFIGQAILDEDGEFGKLTELAVETFQENRSLKTTGEVDEPTWKELIRFEV